jgi:hypothetical protein
MILALLAQSFFFVPISPPMYARSLGRLAMVFVILYLLLVISAVIPVRLLDYLWISRVTGTLINGSSLPLLALLTLIVGNGLYPNDSLLQIRRQLFSRLAVVAALGFLMLIPANIYSGVLQQASNQEQLDRLSVAERQVAAYREAVRQASSVADLDSRLQKLEAPKLGPAEVTLPLSTLKAQMSVLFDQASKQIFDNRQALLAAGTSDDRLKEILRISVACLALAFGFAAFAQTSATGPMLMDSIEDNTRNAMVALRRLRVPSFPSWPQFQPSRWFRPLTELPKTALVFFKAPRPRRAPRRRYGRTSSWFRSLNTTLFGPSGIRMPAFLRRYPLFRSQPRSRRRRSHRHPASDE